MEPTPLETPWEAFCRRVREAASGLARPEEAERMIAQAGEARTHARTSACLARTAA